MSYSGCWRKLVSLNSPQGVKVGTKVGSRWGQEEAERVVLWVPYLPPDELLCLYLSHTLGFRQNLWACFKVLLIRTHMQFKSRRSRGFCAPSFDLLESVMLIGP